MQKTSKLKYFPLVKGNLIAKSCPEDQNFIVTRITSCDYKGCQVVDVEDDAASFNCSWDELCVFDQKLHFPVPTACYAIWNAKWDPAAPQAEDAWTTTYYKATVFPGMKSKKTEYSVAFAGNEQMKCRVPVVVRFGGMIEFPGVIRGEPATNHPAVLDLLPHSLTLSLPLPQSSGTVEKTERPEKRSKRKHESPESSKIHIELHPSIQPSQQPIQPSQPSNLIQLPHPAHPQLLHPSQIVSQPSAAAGGSSQIFLEKPKKIASSVPIAERHLLPFPQVAPSIRPESPAFAVIGQEDVDMLDFGALKGNAERLVGRSLSDAEALASIRDRLGYQSSLGIWHKWDSIRALPSKQLAVAPYVALW